MKKSITGLTRLIALLLCTAVLCCATANACETGLKGINNTASSRNEVYTLNTEMILQESSFTETATDVPTTLTPDENSRLMNSSALFCGDSISYGQWDVVSGYGGWGKRILEAYKMQGDNPSMGGYSISTIRSGRIIDQVNQYKNKSYDYVILQGGVNDAWGDINTGVVAEPGAMTNSFDPADFDTSTFSGGLEELFYYTSLYFPNAKIGFITTFATPNSKGIGRTDDMEPYYSEALKICEKWGVQCLDLYHDKYVTKTLMEVTSYKYLKDPIHPNQAGYERLTPYIASWMEGLVSRQAVLSNPLLNKTALFCGDSISYGHHDSPQGYSWAGRIADQYHTISTNKSCSGWTVSTARGSQIVQQLQQVRANNYNYIILHGGVNDAFENAPIGSLTEGTDSSFDRSTFAGALEHLFKYALTTFPEAKIGYVINFAIPPTDMQPYTDMTIAACRKWGIQYLDLYHDDYVNNTVMAVGTLKYMVDSAHPNKEGYDRLSPIIGQWMTEMVYNKDVPANIEAADKVTDSITALPDDTEKIALEQLVAAKNAYNALTSAQKRLVINYAKLRTAELALLLLTGDPNGDENVTAADALLVLQAAVGKITLNEKQELCSDVDGKKGITAADALLILQKAVEKISEFPVSGGR